MINTNTAALRAQNGSRVANNALQTAMERLSTGKRINTAKDDAAGLAIASKMTSQIRGMNQAIRNANDGISYAQTAEGALGEVTNMLQRIRELAVQSAIGTYATSDRTNLNSEVTELKAQITNILATTEFNGTRIFNSNASGSTYAAASGSGRDPGRRQQRRHRVDQLLVADRPGLGHRGRHRRQRQHGAGQRRHRADQRQLDPREAGRRPEPPGIDGQQADEQRHQPDRRAVADRGCGLLARRPPTSPRPRS